VDVNGREYLRVLAKRWPTVVVGFAACVIVAVVVGLLTPPSYAARTQLFISTLTDQVNPNQQLLQGGSFAADRVKSYTDLATSPRVTVPAVQASGVDISPDELASHISANSPAGTVLITIEVTDEDPGRAAALTNAVANQMATVIRELETPPGASQSPVRAAMIVPAGTPSSPVTPDWPLTLALGVLAGLVVGLGTAIVRDTLDSSLTSEDDLRSVVDVPNLGKIIYDEAALASPVSAHDARSESFRQLRTNLQFSAVGTHSRTFVVTSAVTAEGKSSVTGNLAVAMAQLGLRVTLVDADLRRPSLAGYFGVSGDVGLTTVLIGRTDLSAALQAVRPNLTLLASGTLPPNPSELLSSEPVGGILDALAADSDVVLIDSAPVLPVTDARVIASRCDGVILVVRAGSTHRRQVAEAVESLRKVRATVLGTVLNRLPANEAEGSYYGDYGAPVVGEFQPAAPPEERIVPPPAAPAAPVAPSPSPRPRPTAVSGG
jgi:polysaccharide biosynthesis transport protein